MKIAGAATAQEQEVAQYVHDPSPAVIRALLDNIHLAEDDVLIIANRKNLPQDILENIYRDKRWSKSYPIRLALVRNPKTPVSCSLSIARYLRFFDLEAITRNRTIPLVIRHKIEVIINERIPTMPLGNKITLARKAAGNVLLKLLQDHDAEVVGCILDNPHLTEAHLFKLLSLEKTIAETVRMIGEHPNWSRRTFVRLALVRNMLTPLALSVRFLQEMRLVDLRELYADPSVPITIRPFIHRELLRRGQDPVLCSIDQVFEFNEEDLAEADAILDMPEYREKEEQDDGGRS